MNKEDKQRTIGKIVAINSDRFTVELLGGIDNFNINGYDDIHYFAQLNSYVVILYQNYYIIAEVAGVRERDLNVPFNNPTEQVLSKIKSGKYLDVVPIGTLKQKEGGKDYSFDFGVSVYPALYTDVMYIKEAELDAVFNTQQTDGVLLCSEVPDGQPCIHGQNKRYKTLSIGKSNIFPDYDIKVDIDKFFGGHSAVLGNTGSGKSCTIASMVQGLFKLKDYSAAGSTFIFFDVNGEYTQAFSDLTTSNPDVEVVTYSLLATDDKKISLPHYFLNFEEWALLLQASEKTHQPVLRNALALASLFDDPEVDLIPTKNHIVATCALSIWANTESPVSAGRRVAMLLQDHATGTMSKTLLADMGFNFRFGNFGDGGTERPFLEKLGEFVQEDFKMPELKISKFDFARLCEFLDIAILFEEAHGNKQIRDYCSSMMTRAKALVERKEFEFLNPTVETESSFRKKILGFEDAGTDHIKKKYQVVVFDLSSAEDEVVEIISCVLTRLIYEFLKERQERNKLPVNLVLEEAHRYIADDPKRSFLKASRIFESVAKEGRKFGLFMTISSQRPSELSRTVLSQCSNFIVHRIQNPEDLSHIRQITPHISETILKRMPSIPTQNALIFGHSVNLPATFRVNDASPKPKSDNNEVSKNWFIPKGHSISAK